MPPRPRKTYTPGRGGAPATSERLTWSRRARGAASSTRSASVRAPRSCARPTRRTRISAVARASGSARWHGSVGTPKKWASAASPTRRVRSPSRRRASQTVSTTGAAIRRPVRSSTSRSRNARSKRALCATIAPSPANARNCRTASSQRGAPRSASARIPVSDVTAGGQRDARVDEGLECVPELERADALGADLADARRPRREPGRLEVDDDEVRVLEKDVGARGRREADRGAAPGEPRVADDHVVEERARERGRGAREREEDRAPRPRPAPAPVGPRRAPRGDRRRRTRAACARW